MLSDQFKVALVRALIGAFISAGLTFFATVTTSGAAAAGIAAGTAGFTYLAARGFAEGAYDTRRQENHRVIAGDVR